jgi:chemotaxis signal transduction protein
MLPCGIGSEVYALDMSWVQTIARLDPAAASQWESPTGDGEDRAPESLRPVGALAVEKAEIPLHLLAERLGRPDSSARPDSETRSGEEPPRAIVLRLSPPWALVVDRVGRPFSVQAGQVVALPEVAADPGRDVFDGVVLADDRIFLLLAPDRLIAHARQETPWRTESLPAGPRATRERSVDRKTSDPALAASRRLVRFSLPQQTEPPKCAFALSLSQVPEVLEVPPVIPVPFAPAFVRGLIRWRDRVVPVIDLARRLRLPCAAGQGPSEKTRLVIARSSRTAGERGGPARGTSSELWGGFVVRSDVRITPVPPAQRMSGSSVPLAPEMTSGVFECPDGCLVIPDLGTVLTQTAWG